MLAALRARQLTTGYTNHFANAKRSLLMKNLGSGGKTKAHQPRLFSEAADEGLSDSGDVESAGTTG